MSSLITFRDKNTSGDPVGPTWYLQFDALTVEEVSRSADVTQYPVETGATLSDHYQPMPREITMTGVVTDTPSGAWTNLEGMENAAAPPVMVERPMRIEPRPDPRRVGAAGIARPLGTSILPGRRVIQSNVERARLYIPAFAQVLQVAGTGDRNTRSGVNRISRFTEMLDGLMQSRTSVSVILQTGAEYANMFITDMRAPRVARTSGSVSFSLDMVEVIEADPVKETKGAQQRSRSEHKPKKAAGSKGKKDVKDGTIEANRIDGTGMPDSKAKSLILQLKAARP